jgi:hypothetical protein
MSIVLRAWPWIEEFWFDEAIPPRGVDVALLCRRPAIAEIAHPSANHALVVDLTLSERAIARQHAVRNQVRDPPRPEQGRPGIPGAHRSRRMLCTQADHDNPLTPPPTVSHRSIAGVSRSGDPQCNNAKWREWDRKQPRPAALNAVVIRMNEERHSQRAQECIQLASDFVPGVVL